MLLSSSMCSMQRVAKEGVGWKRSGEDIAYYKSSLYYRSQSRTPFRTLTFSYTGEYKEDEVCFRTILVDCL